MTEHPAAPPTPEPPPGAPARWSRRRLFVAGALGLGAAWAAGARSPAGASGVLARLEAPGNALRPAVRVASPPGGDPPEPVGGAPAVDDPPAAPDDASAPVVEPPAPGEILFPIVVGADDSCYVLDNYGDCRGSGCSRRHEGVDIMTDRGLVVMATVAGELTKKYEDSGLSYGAGHGWTLAGDDGVVYKFFHLDRHEDGLEVGSRVEQGQVIGYVGNTGTSGVLHDPPTNHHLHFEYRPNNVPADPFHVLQRPEHVVFAS